MVQILDERRDVLGGVGKGIGKGLSESVPKEIERGRLASGLKQFEQDSAGLSPMQQLARLSSIPGITPQMIQSFGQLGLQQAKGDALKNVNASKPSPFPQQQNGTQAQGSEIPSITKEKPLEQIQQGYIPATTEQMEQRAGELYNQNPARFGNDPEQARAYAREEESQKEKINQAYQTQHQNLNDIQDNVVNRLGQQATKLGVKIPSNVYSKIEDKAIQATKPKNQGGDGLTEQQAMKKYGDELDKVSRDYEGIKTIGDWGIVGRKSGDTLRSMKSLQQKFEDRNDTENYADKLVAENKLSPMVAYSIAQPVSKVNKLNNEITKIPEIQNKIDFKKGYASVPVPEEYIRDQTLDISKKLAPLLGEKGSPLAVAYELEKKGYDPGIWLDYLTQNRDDLGLKEFQGRQLDKPRNLMPTLNDWWLNSWSGLEK